MRPQEILGMMEEAAGTRMFEERKEKAKRTMGKKEKRVEEITSVCGYPHKTPFCSPPNQLLEEEITPKLNRLREQKRSYLTYQKTTSELERLARFLRAYDWTEASARVQRKDEAVRERKAAVEEARRDVEERTREGAEAEKERTRIEKKRDRELAKGGKLKALEEEANAFVKELARLGTQAEIKEGTIEDEKKKVRGLESNVSEVCSAFPTLEMCPLIVRICLLARGIS